ncbi:hypothetical protein DCC24_01040 [Auritidibacter sp. NML100628]|nr:hypothetical protein DCC24_01040 [Auritidibacter sp. NML100628]
MTEEQKSRGGRPRSVASHEAILQATSELLAEGGHHQVTMESIAARAGVSKQTIYRWWSSKNDVVLEAISQGKVTYYPAPAPHTDQLKADLLAWMSTELDKIFDDADTPQLVQNLISMVAAAGEDAEQLFRPISDPLMNVLIGRLRHAEREQPGTLRSSPEIIAEMVAGALLWRLLIKRPVPEHWAESILDAVL